ncbi:M24 family metallopeptidase [Natronobeatus ordinarius]|uniref:M24 family metallopeptidase n=1 Tax=Natronobeatus ordinarius TaxID=2963433 RepID=UPI0020CCC2D7|nr:Xaa-Pro peptidase family protein [Natronobeatus ordinarius]
MTDPFDRRLRDCRRRLEAAGAEAVVCFPSSNLTYLTGFEESPSERHLLLVLPTVGAPAFVAPTMYAEQLAETPVEDVRLWDDGDDPVALLEDVLSDRGIRDGSVLVDDRMWALFTQDLRRLLPDASFDLASVVFEALRLRKDDVELEALRRAGEIADRVSLTLRARCEELVGTTEAALADDIGRLLGEHGGGAPSFSPIVASGPNGARPHHHSGDRVIEAGDPVVLDFGAYVEADLESGTARYPGDQTRTIVFAGEPPAEYREVHAIVCEAQQAAVDAVEPGVTAGSIDRAARSVIEAAGYGDAFVHRTGHGVGLEVHEPPYIVAGNDRELEPGMVFSVEPGIYLEGRFGVRIEDLVVVTEDGAERLNDSPRGWRADDA